MVRSMAMTFLALLLLLVPTLAYGNDPEQIAVEAAAKARQHFEDMENDIFDFFYQSQGMPESLARRCTQQYGENYVQREVRKALGTPSAADLANGPLVNVDSDCTKPPIDPNNP